MTFGVFLFALVSLVSLFDPTSTWQVTSLFRILGALKNVLSYFAYLAMGSGGVVSAGAFSLGSSVYQDAFRTAIEPLLFQYLNTIFHMTNDAGQLVTYASFDEMVGGSMTSPSIFSLLGGQALTIASNGYFLLLLLCVLLSFVFALMFVARCDIRHSIYSAVAMVAPIIVALFPGLIIYILEMVNVPGFLGEAQWLDFLAIIRGNPLADPPVRGYFPEIIFLDSGILSGEMSPATFFTHPGFRYALLVYLFLETSFQASYVARVTQPSIERTRRLESQVSVLGERSVAFELEQQQRVREGKVESTLMVKGEGEKQRLTLRTFFTGGGLDAIKELLERRERERERERLEEVSSDTRRLDTYIKRLFEIDKNARAALTAVGSAPGQAGMVASTFLNMGVRLAIMIGLTFVIVNPILLFQVFRIPDIVGSSVGFNSPEAVVTTLVPLILLFPLVSFIIRTRKQYMLTLEKNRREEESTLLKRISELREIESEETVDTGTPASS